MKKLAIDKFRDKRWYSAGKLHREDGPAVEWVNGDREWWSNGDLHREGGPAVEHADGHKEWFLNGSLHREDGPAVEYANGCREWWLNGEYLTKEELLKSLPTELQEKALFNSVFIVR